MIKFGLQKLPGLPSQIFSMTYVFHEVTGTDLGIFTSQYTNYAEGPRNTIKKKKNPAQIHTLRCSSTHHDTISTGELLCKCLMTIADIQAQGIFKEYLLWSFQLLTDWNSNRFSASFLVVLIIRMFLLFLKVTALSYGFTLKWQLCMDDV